MRSVALLGSTGSIGRQAIQVCDDDPDLHVCALAAGSDAPPDQTNDPKSGLQDAITALK